MRVLRAIGRWLGALLLVLAARRRRRAEDKRILPPPADDRRASNAVLLLLGASCLASTGFALAYLFGGSTQLLGLSIGAALACLAAASIVAAKRLVPQEEHEEPLASHEHVQAREETAQIVREGAEGLSRRRLLLAAAGGSVGLCGGVLVLPAASLGPVLETELLLDTPWRAGRLLVDEHDRPIVAEEIAVGSFVTAFAAGIEKGRLDASLVVVRIEPGELRLPAARAGWAPAGVLAYSKICTHAACAVSEFEYPTYRPTSPRPRLVCPCHYSAFDVTSGGDVLFGPAGRPLPQLPLRIDAAGRLVADGQLSAPPGPSWSGVRQR
jgi:ubiquinol-cytochrome c reductase iron-sulfur subunit